jgi:four helix bundle protein
MDYQDWASAVPSEISDDSLWKVEAYRLALFLTDLCWEDIKLLHKDRRLSGLSDQLYRSVGSISANIAEGYSRGYPKDRARFYEYALGSAREARDWYYKGRHKMNKDIFRHRLDVITRITRLLLTMVPDQRGRKISEGKSAFSAYTNEENNDF